MKAAVRYYTMTGNSKKLAEAAAQAAGVQPQDTSVPLEEGTNILFLCSAVYATGVSQEIKNFIRDNKDKIGKIVNISSAALLPSTYKQVSKVARANGVTMCEEEFHCRGQFKNMHKEKPDAEDLKQVEAFTRRILEA